MKKLLTAGALLLASSTAFAGISYDEFITFGDQGVINDVSISDLSAGLTISTVGFNAALGNLTGVTVEVSTQINTVGTETNNSVALGRGAAALFMFTPWGVSTSAADDIEFASAGSFLLSTESSAIGTYTLSNGDVYDYDLSTGQIDNTFANVNSAEFLGAVDFTFSAFAQSISTSTVQSGTKDFGSTAQTGTWGQVKVTYEYDAISTTVPETGSLAIFGLGLAGLALSRKAKKSA